MWDSPKRVLNKKMGFYKYIQELWKKPKENLPELWRERLIKWRREDSITKIEKPTRLDRARNLGYKAKKGFFIVRVRVKRGGRKRPQIKKGRRPKHYRHRKILSKSYQIIAEERAGRKFRNCEVLNSYFVAKDGIYYWYEIILMDRMIVRNYKEMAWVGDSKGRVFRGKTSAGKKSRGMRGKGKGYEKIRPSLRSKGRKGN